MYNNLKSIIFWNQAKNKVSFENNCEDCLCLLDFMDIANIKSCFDRKKYSKHGARHVAV